MPRNTKQSVPYAQQQLTLAIAQLKQGGPHEEILPMLETVLSQLQTLATHDSLTGALNRRALLAKLEFELARSLRTGHSFSFAVIGIDHLPEIMEQFGQDATKHILQIVTAQANAMLRTLDSFGRIAATEFAIVMPTTWLDQSLKAIARLQAHITEVDWSDTVPGRNISFCTGLTANAPGDSADKMLARALAALKKAKALGAGEIAQIEADLPSYDANASE
jgi:diguanylate cyclase (GGDEF)-like protein